MGNGSSKIPTNALKFEEISTVEENENWIQKNGFIKINSNSRLSDCEYCVFQDKNRSSDSPLQRNLKNLMLYRHPNILKYVSSWVLDERHYLVTEAAYPLEMVFEGSDWSEIVAGLHDIAQALNFLHEKAGCVHGHIGLHAIYASKEGTWKLGRLENLVKINDAPDKTNPTLVDFKNYFKLIELISNILGDTNNSFLREFLNLQHSQDDISWNRILDHSIFESCKFLQVRNFLQHFVVKSKEDKEKFFCDLGEDLTDDNLANNLTSHLCELLFSRVVVLEPSAAEFLAVFLSQFNFEVADKRSKIIIETILQPKILTMFRVRDTRIRLFLLNNFNAIARVFAPVQLQNLILPELLLGIKDTNPEIVEHTLRALADLVPILGVWAVIGARNRSKIFSESRPVAAAAFRQNCGGQIADDFGPSKSECTRQPPDGVENEDELWTSFDDNWTERSGGKADIGLVEKSDENDPENTLSGKLDEPAIDLSLETEDPIDDLIKDMEPVLSKPQVLIVDEEETEKTKVRFRVGSVTDEEDGWGENEDDGWGDG